MDSDDAGSEGTFRDERGLRFRHMQNVFSDMDQEERKRALTELLSMCDGKLLGYVANFVAPRLKRDPFGVLPNELCLRVGLHSADCIGALLLTTKTDTNLY